MKLSETQVELLKGVKNNLRRGDLDTISSKTGFSKQYICKILNHNNSLFNDSVLDIAVQIIKERECKAKSLLKEIGSI